MKVGGDQACHLRQTSGRYNVPRVDQAVQVAGAAFDLLAHVVVDFHIEDIGDEIEGMLVVVDVRVKAGEVEAVGEIVFVDLAEVFVAFG